ncbi:MAG TPA: TIGR01777 family oxidoreductase [Jiangellaceae bacterium]
MAHTFTTTVAAPRHEVFEWHSQPGAIHRLTPPWLPVRVLRESPSLRDGSAVISMLGVPWVAQHGRADYDPPRQFSDELVTTGLRRLLRWRHVHSFEAAGSGATKVVDRVDARVPRRAVESFFRYRHDQLAADLWAHQRARTWSDRPMMVAVTGASGTIGTALAAFLTTGGHRVIRLVRRSPRSPDERRWQPADPDPELVTGVDVLVHLAGESLAGRFTAARREAVMESRVAPTRRLAELIARQSSGPRAFVTASAIGYYGADRGAELLTEDSPRGDGFLADVVSAWEDATRPAAEAGVRVAQLRTGVVQTPIGGMLRLLAPLFWAGLGGRIGTGEQWLSWIALDDLLDIYLRAMLDDDLHGPVNAVAPEPVTNREYTRTLAKVLGRPALVPVPRWAPGLLLGGAGAAELALASQRVSPAKLIGEGHKFRYATLEPALRHVLGR